MSSFLTGTVSGAEIGFIYVLDFIFSGMVRLLFMWTAGLLFCAAIFHLLIYLSGGRQGFLKTLSVVMYGITPLLVSSWIAGITGNPRIASVAGIPLFICLLAFVPGRSSS